MAGGIRYLVCCDDCGVDAIPNEEVNGEYATEVIARTVRDWAATEGGWLLTDPNTEEQWLSCPECAAIQRKKMSVPVLKLVPSVKE